VANGRGKSTHLNFALDTGVYLVNFSRREQDLPQKREKPDAMTTDERLKLQKELIAMRYRGRNR
jgi:hypothetical protein